MLPFSRPVLVVDDCRSAAFIVQRLLNRIGFSEVDVRHSAEEGHFELQRRAYAFAVVDIEMPSSSGLEMLSQIRRKPRTWDLPVLLTTGNPQCVASGNAMVFRMAPTSFILKPFSCVDLKRKLSEMLEQPFAREELLPSEMARKYHEWAPSGRRRELESTLLTRIKRATSM